MLGKKIGYSAVNYYSCWVDRIRSVGICWLDKLEMSVSPDQLGYLLPAYLPTCLPAYLPTCLPANLPTCLPAYLPTYLPAYLPTCLCLSSKLTCSGTCPGRWVGGRLGEKMAGLVGNIAISAQLELELGLSLATI